MWFLNKASDKATLKDLHVVHQLPKCLLMEWWMNATFFWGRKSQTFSWKMFNKLLLFFQANHILILLDSTSFTAVKEKTSESPGDRKEVVCDSHCLGTETENTESLNWPLFHMLFYPLLLLCIIKQVMWFSSDVADSNSHKACFPAHGSVCVGVLCVKDAMSAQKRACL